AARSHCGGREARAIRRSGRSEVHRTDGLRVLASLRTISLRRDQALGWTPAALGAGPVWCQLWHQCALGMGGLVFALVVACADLLHALGNASFTFPRNRIQRILCLPCKRPWRR